MPIKYPDHHAGVLGPGDAEQLHPGGIGYLGQDIHIAIGNRRKTLCAHGIRW
jgi:hypothetical protein